MADGARLESVYTLKRIVGSNPTSSDFTWSLIAFQVVELKEEDNFLL